VLELLVNHVLHGNPHEYAGKTVDLLPGVITHLGELQTYKVEDWWDRVSGESWMASRGNPAALHFAMRSGLQGLPLDDEVVYGKDANGYGHLIHVSEIKGVRE